MLHRARDSGSGMPPGSGLPVRSVFLTILSCVRNGNEIRGGYFCGVNNTIKRMGISLRRFFFLCATILFPCLRLVAQDACGTLAGVVTDAATGQPLVGVTVLVSGTLRGAASGADGTFTIGGLKPGSYAVEASMLTYDSRQIGGVVVGPGRTTQLDIALTEQSEQLDEVVVTAIRRTGSEVAVNREVRDALMVMSGVSGQALAKTQDRDAGEVVRRIPGITLIDGKFVIARGLAQRYNNVWVNNAAVPSSEPDSRAFSFDIIPAGQIENILVLKSPAPEIPADFSGGFIRIQTRDLPAEDAVSIAYSAGINTATHFTGFLHAKGFAADYLGFGSGGRMWQGGMTGAFDNTDAQRVTALTREGFDNDWRIRKRSAVPDQRFSASLGKSWSLRGGARLALTGALNYSYVSRTYTDMENSRFGIYNKREDKPEYLYKYTDDQYRTDVRVGAMLNLACVAGDSRYYLRNLFNQLGQSRYTFREGWQNISSLYNQQKAEYLYSSRSAYNGQLAGVHDLGRGRLEWNAGYAYADRNLPDRRIINRQQNDIYGDDRYGQMQIDQNEIQRDFTRLSEHIVSAGLNYEYAFRPGKPFAPKFRTGLYGEYRTRAYRARSFRYRFDPAALPGDFSYGDPVNDILRPENYGAGKLYLYDDTDNRDSYEGENLLTAAYAGLHLPVGCFSLYAGARFEHSAMTLTGYTRISEWTSAERDYNYNDVFPSANATFRLSEKHLLRAAYGMSTNRPEFREVSASTFYDFELFSTVMGNPDLTAAYVHNADLRYEWYPSAGESVSLAVFYKRFRHPIETTIRDAGGSYTYTFENADRANVYGVELDVRKNLDFLGMPAFSVSLNVSLIESRVLFGEESLEHDRPMQGQSPYIVNCGLFYQPERAGLTVGLLYNRIGKRIIGIGRSDLTSGGSIDNDIPDMYEMPRNVLDLVVSKRLGKRWELRFSAKDLICDRIELCQFPQFTDDAGTLHERREVTKTYNPGRSFTLGAAVKF